MALAADMRTAARLLKYTLDSGFPVTSIELENGGK
jgi:hypothetical protein